MCPSLAGKYESGFSVAAVAEVPVPSGCWKAAAWDLHMLAGIAPDKCHLGARSRKEIPDFCGFLNVSCFLLLAKEAIPLLGQFSRLFWESFLETWPGACSSSPAKNTHVSNSLY